MDKAHTIINASVTGDTLILTVDGTERRINLSNQSKLLADASHSARSHFIVSSSGYGIHWPDLDVDLSIDGLIGINHSVPLLEAMA